MSDAPITAALLTTRQVADELDISVQRVGAIARSRGLGILVTRQMRVFSQADLAAMRERKRNAGRPRKGAV